MDDYSKLLPYAISDFKDFKVFQKYISEYIDYSKASFNLSRSGITSWEEFGNVSTIGGNLFLYESQISSLGNLQSVGGNLNLSHDTNLKSLGNLESVGGDLYLTNTAISSLGNLESVGGDLYIWRTNLTSLGNLREVKGGIHYDNGDNVEKLLKERNLI